MSERFLNVLIIEDVPEWAKDISDSLRISAKDMGYSINFLYAENIRQAESMTVSYCLHGISTDQGMPETTGGEVSNDHGERYIRSLQTWEPPSYMAVYTALPHTGISNLAGQRGISDYITKSASESEDGSGHRYMSVTAYADHFISQIVQQYLKRVLSLASQSGFRELQAISRKTLETYEDFLATEERDERLAWQFVAEFFKIQESLNPLLIALFSSIEPDQNETGSNKEASRSAEASSIEVELRRLINRLENRGDLAAVKTYFHIQAPRNIATYYIDSCKFVRELRNRAVHTEWNFNHEAYDQVRPHLVRVCDMLAWFLRRPMLVSLHRSRDYFLRGTDIRQQYPRVVEHYFEHEIPSSTPYDLFTMLSDDSPLIRLSPRISAKPDESTGRPSIAFS